MKLKFTLKVLIFLKIDTYLIGSSENGSNTPINDIVSVKPSEETNSDNDIKSNTIGKYFNLFVNT